MIMGLKRGFAATIFSAGLITDTAWAGDPSLNFGGRFMLDYTSADLSSPDSEIKTGEIRRFSVKVFGDLSDNLEYKIEVTIDPDDDNLIFEDVLLKFTPGGGDWAFAAGHQKTTNSLDELTSSRFISALERSAFTDAFGFDRRLGVSVGTSGDNYSFAAGIYSSNLEGVGGGSTGRGKAASARVTYNPVKTKDMIVHLGASWRYRGKGDDNSNLRYRQRPYTHAAPSRIINTGRFAKSDNFFGLEAAATNGKLWVAGEAAFMKAHGAGANPDANFGGYYSEAGLFFGGKKVYKGNRFNRPKVDKPFGQGGMGAVSVVVRYDSVDLQDALYTGKLDTVILGADWWPTQKTRFGINYFNADAKNGSADKGEGFLARTQFDF